MNHLKRYWHEELARKSFLTPGEWFSSLACLYDITSSQSGTTQPHGITLSQENYWESESESSPFSQNKPPPSWVDLFLSVSVPEVSMCMEAAHDDDNGGEEKKKKKRKPQLSSRVAHGKVCTGARTLPVWVKAMYTVGQGTALCWVTSLHDIWLTETNARGVSVKNDPIALLWFN